MGIPFGISRSITQGFPLAFFLYLLFVESFSAYINLVTNAVLGLNIPPNRKLIDFEFADDTTLYLKGLHLNLENVQNPIQTFCNASRALINWHKSAGFWVSDTPQPHWMPAMGFRWIPHGVAIHYLGVQVGMDVPVAEMVRPLMELIKQKLLMWYHVHLSLAGWVMIVNQVLLATIWYVASSWLFSRSLLSPIWSVIRNFLWLNKFGTHARAKVAWLMITQKEVWG